MWVLRAGQKGQYYNKFISTQNIFLPWNGYDFDLSEYSTISEFRSLVENEKGIANTTTISNWAGQLFSFVRKIQINDYVLIPGAFSRSYTLAKISGNYEYNHNDEDKLYHKRKVIILLENIPRNIFNQSIIYSLGAYRTLFIAKYEKEILQVIKEWSDKTNETSIQTSKISG